MSHIVQTHQTEYLLISSNSTAIYLFMISYLTALLDKHLVLCISQILYDSSIKGKFVEETVT